jgi:hypothetical protein
VPRQQVTLKPKVATMNTDEIKLAIVKCIKKNSTGKGFNKTLH